MKQQFALAPIFSDYMVFQSNKAIKIFGTCKKGAEIYITFPHQEVKIKAQSDFFSVEIDEMKVTKQGFSFTVTSKKQSQTIFNCLVGDVFLLSGEKNVTFKLHDSFEPLISENNMVRYYSLLNENYPVSSFECVSSWMISDQETASSFSAFGYYIGALLNENLQIPIGIILAAQDESSIFSWIEYKDILSNDRLRKVIIDYQKALDHFPSKDDYNYVFEKQTEVYQREHRLDLLPMGPRHINRPSGLFDTLISKITPYPLKSVVFYHGETNFNDAAIYEDGFKTMIRNWRKAFNDSKLPFFFMQIAGFDYQNKDELSIPVLREAQSNCANHSDSVFMTTAIDLGEASSITPKDKVAVSERMTNLILEKLYKVGKNTISPSFFSYQINKDKMVVYTQNNPLNLVSISMQNLGIYLSYDHERFFEAKNVKLMNNQIEIPNIKMVKEVRYGYSELPLIDIYSSNGLPLLPFRIQIDK